MDSGLLWTIVGSVTAVIATVLAAWQVCLQLAEHRQSKHHLRTSTEGGTGVEVPSAVPQEFWFRVGASGFDPSSAGAEGIPRVNQLHGGPNMHAAVPSIQVPHQLPRDITYFTGRAADLG
jgi:hypothetical protein